MKIKTFEYKSCNCNCSPRYEEVEKDTDELKEIFENNVGNVVYPLIEVIERLERIIEKFREDEFEKIQQNYINEVTNYVPPEKPNWDHIKIWKRNFDEQTRKIINGELDS
jgi:hypothetical protein